MKNIPLIIDIKRQQGKYTVISDEEAISIGTLEMINAINKFDESKNCSFATYATKKIKAKLDIEANSKSDNIGTAKNTTRIMKKISQAENDLYMKLGRKPTNDEIAEVVGVTANTVNRYNILINPISLQDSSVNGDSNTSTLEQVISYPSEEKFERKIELEELSLLLKKLMKNLTKQEKQVIKLRFGLEDGIPRTLEEVGQILGPSRERIRQIENKGLKKLRTPQKKKVLKEFLTD